MGYALRDTPPAAGPVNRALLACDAGARVGERAPRREDEVRARIARMSPPLPRARSVDHALEPCDVIPVLGSHDLRVAERGAELYLEGWAPLLVSSGCRGT